MDWTTCVWRALCLLASISGLAGVTGLVWGLSPLLQGVLVGGALIVGVLAAVGLWADWSERSERRCADVRRDHC